MTNKQAIEQLKKITWMEYDLKEILNIIDELKEDTRNEITQFINEKYITNDEEESWYIENQDKNIVRLKIALGGVNYEEPICINGYGNLENVKYEDVISEIIDLLEEMEKGE